MGVVPRRWDRRPLWEVWFEDRALSTKLRGIARKGIVHSRAATSSVLQEQMP